MPDDLKLGYSVPEGEQVDVPVFHTVITGITRHGKSESMKALAERARDEGYTLLVFDTKTPRDYGGLGVDIPIYLEEHTDPTTLKGLLENQSGMGLNFQFSELIKMYEPGDTYHDMLERMATAMEDDIHPVEEDKLRVLVHLLESLTEELDRVEITDDLSLTEGAINVMDLHAVDGSIQQLAIAGSVQQVLDHHTDTIILVDEAHNFIPQRRSPPARDPLVKTIREGGAGNNWLWISDQTITGVDKDPLKQVGVWILGKQREKNEAKRVLDQIPGSTSYAKEDVMTLDKGHFIVALDDAQPLVYVQPTWVGDVDARNIATRDAFVENHEPPADETTEIDMDETLQEKEEQLRKKEERIAGLEDRLEAVQAEKEELEAKVDQLFGDLEDAREQETVPLEGAAPAPEWTMDEDRVREVVEDYIAEMEVPEGLRVERSVPKLVVTKRVEQLRLDDSTTRGRTAILYAEGVMPEADWFSTGDLQTWFEERGWDRPSPNTSVLDDFARWGYLEKEVTDRRQYRVALIPEEAQDRGLLEYSEQVA